ncbi:MAG: SpoIID/LytB domain-containing protein [Clostridia bacterium]|nr:SpoIID/LytB domain-containing protein [Clostridia bacterium]
MRTPDVESCLPVILSLQIKEDYEPEAVKAQAIIARSNVYRQMEEGKNIFDILEKTGEKLKDTYGIKDIVSKLESWEIYEEAVSETEDKVLTSEGELKLIPYHEISSGMTRNGQEVLHNEEYSYLKSVESSGDKTAADYLNSVYVSARQMPKKLVIKSRDSAGYVTMLLADENPLEGEAFRQGLGLSSADFTVQIVGSKYRFLCKGKGHGLGFSQYGGNSMAKEGSTCEEILKTYFPAMNLEDIWDIR